MNVAVYAEEDEQNQRYYLLRALGPVLTLQRDQSDDFGQEHKRGDRVLVGESELTARLADALAAHGSLAARASLLAGQVDG